MSRHGREASAYRGRRAGRACKGFPGTWEILSSPTRREPGEGAPGDQPLALGGLHGASPGSEKDTVPGGVPGSVRRTKRTGMGDRKSEHPHTTDEAGEPTRRDPVEGRGMSGHGTVGGKGNRHVEV